MTDQLHTFLVVENENTSPETLAEFGEFQFLHNQTLIQLYFPE